MALLKKVSGWRDWLGLVRTSHLLIFVCSLAVVSWLVGIALLGEHPIRPWWVNAVAMVCLVGSMVIDGRWRLINKRLGEIYQAHLTDGFRSRRAARFLSVLGMGLVLIYFMQVIRSG
jgi:hypothetical protein